MFAQESVRGLVYFYCQLSIIFIGRYYFVYTFVCKLSSSRQLGGRRNRMWDPEGRAYGIYKLWHQTFPCLRESVCEGVYGSCCVCFVGASKLACHCRLICLLGFVCRSPSQLAHRFCGRMVGTGD